jgi:hypothetical protein
LQSSPAKNPESLLLRQITIAHDVQGGVRKWGGDRCGRAFHFFPSPVQKKDEGVMMYLERNRIADL